jgi:hypothetical protein
MPETFERVQVQLCTQLDRQFSRLHGQDPHIFMKILSYDSKGRMIPTEKAALKSKQIKLCKVTLQA